MKDKNFINFFIYSKMSPQRRRKQQILFSSTTFTLKINFTQFHFSPKPIGNQHCFYYIRFIKQFIERKIIKIKKR